jgi:predicted PurR-regulated permease PerM
VSDGPEERDGRPSGGLHAVGRTAWAIVGILLVAAAVAIAAGELTLVLVPAILALFPATLLIPLAAWMKRHGVPDALSALLTILAGLLFLAAIIGAMIPLVLNELPDLLTSAGEGLQELSGFLEDGPLGLEIGGIEGLLDMAAQQLGDAGGADQAVDVAVTTFEVIAGILLLIVTLFFYLKDGRRLALGLVTTVPPRHRDRVARSAGVAWDTLGRYFRGQLLVALVDAIFIGLGLWLLGVPLALPLAVLIFFGGLFPIVGAVTTGALAVLVALADAGLTSGLIVLGLVLLVQQLESNVLEPLILGRVIALHPFVIIVVITSGSVLLGILGAFLAVPVAAIAARVIEDLREEDPDDRDDQQVRSELLDNGGPTSES